MIFIAGVTERSKTIEEGLFDCPICQQQRQYVHKQFRNYLSFFFIPLIPVHKTRENVTCKFCLTNMPVHVLNK
ncbi:zinc ribbon domain-containing protein [Empedobacter falsenii]|uniref:Zinc ribbon domain-containing protein n=2 Tax=Empedobacter TaxID=59734 RepID=A0ABY8VCT9_9FLAO|nr:zinc-ribbon domain-containing protein [Empedobacter falsenii]NOJ74672.1 zinc-ribbon domain-containing protein [Empedobacter stercoris]WIH98093.1 zinc ribbon domain-containing protein [Empedobacter falsenii]HJD87409.1 zinc ribbon domain-containing protein [Empedobacter falsenii]